ncbi:N-acetylmuramoyl-L-alanine amidase [Staphylococcus carnosus]|uniref:Cell wall amidase n=1 Tax=Staphylococcus carnosus TaxID=1281 RepID=A0AAJ0JQY1_STACA|nr:N-acetylmuramoyl-L-alanine amidase [Staphylococcus carnosus]ANZ33213.1 cell wall amidase [Staphylococcus carnosus]KKB26110.1 cell wall amidase [Staphylococcus carnosus]POA08147.1 cell wall amidase [Staphylococcus carnosus]QQS85077.1 N-acetylmuramoyl-L-alanine amidase [Staphylococcus carnosus]QRQ05016.1 N-acetylmuramoyl-L-alanine amidase [Staphylococcus carnosus]
MNRIENWFKKRKLKPIPIFIALIALIVLIFIIIIVANYQADHNDKVTMKEDAELRTGPNAVYPEIFPADKGETFKQLDKKGKWLYVSTQDGKEKGWVAGWHTNLNIPPDNDPNAKPLKNKVIVLDPGHGGGDQGASSSTPSKSLEKVYTLKTGLELKKLLEQEGAKVKMTRDKDEYVKLKDRNLSGDAFISLHNDALKSSDANGVTVYWYKKQQEGLAEALSMSIQKKAILSPKGARQENYQVLRQSKIPAVLIELGYISNPTDEMMITDKLHRHIVEQAIVDGLRTYFSN